ncbi:MAG: hypothetical protein K2Y37_01945 [Pirellulales bacterium]|nr:hypothetical protein [Pirellulales bacterium]
MPRPVSVIIFGALNLVFGAFSLLGVAIQLVVVLGFANQMQPEFDGVYGWYQTIMTPIGVAAVFAQIGSGVGLLLLKQWGRKLALGFAVYMMLASVLNIVMMLLYRGEFMEQFTATMPDAEFKRIFGVAFLATVVFATLVWFSYPALMWYYMTRPHVIAAFRGEAPPTIDYGDLGAQALAVQAALPAAAPSDNPFDAPVAWETPRGAGSPLAPPADEAASTALYLGIGSLIPCLAIGLGPAAVVVGRRALAAAKLHPHRSGETQAFLGILLGGGCFVLNVGFLVMGLVFAVMGLTMVP